MKFLSLLTGRVFQDLLQHGKDIEEAIARRDTRLLDNSTPELERYFSRPLSELPRQNPYPVAMLLPLFLVAFALNLLPFLSTLQGLSPLHHALSFFLPSLTMTGSWKDVGIVGLYGVVHHPADNDPRSGSTCHAFS